jgi:hypothetical protein
MCCYYQKWSANIMEFYILANFFIKITLNLIHFGVLIS